jgi:hypothetical protein
MAKAVPARTGREILIRLFGRTLLWAAVALAALFVIDFAVLRIRVATNHHPFDTVTVRPYYAVPQKDHKTEFLVQDPQDQTCVNSLFPHMGDSPCWYLIRHTEQRIDM